MFHKVLNTPLFDNILHVPVENYWNDLDVKS